MKTFEKLEMIVNGGERITLVDGDKFQNFEKLHAICGSRYDDINDEAMDGPDANGRAYVKTIYKNGEAVSVILFIYDSGRYVVNDSGEAVWMDAAVEMMDDDLREEIHKDLAPCSDQAFYNEYCRRHLEKYGVEFVTV